MLLSVTRPWESGGFPSVEPSLLFTALTFPHHNPEGSSWPHLPGNPTSDTAIWQQGAELECDQVPKPHALPTGLSSQITIGIHWTWHLSCPPAGNNPKVAWGPALGHQPISHQEPDDRKPLTFLLTCSTGACTFPPLPGSRLLLSSHWAVPMEGGALLAHAALPSWRRTRPGRTPQPLGTLTLSDLNSVYRKARTHLECKSTQVLASAPWMHKTYGRSWPHRAATIPPEGQLGCRCYFNTVGANKTCLYF